jgi:hypothetical protein
MVLADPILSKIYQNKEIVVLKKKYSFFVAGIVGGKFDWLGKNIEDTH